MSLDNISTELLLYFMLYGVTFLGHIWWLLFYIYSGDINTEYKRLKNHQQQGFISSV